MQSRLALNSSRLYAAPGHAKPPPLGVGRSSWVIGLAAACVFFLGARAVVGLRSRDEGPEWFDTAYWSRDVCFSRSTERAVQSRAGDGSRYLALDVGRTRRTRRPSWNDAVSVPW